MKRRCTPWIALLIGGLFFVAGCSPAQVAIVPTLAGPIVPTRAPTLTPTLEAVAVSTGEVEPSIDVVALPVVDTFETPLPFDISTAGGAEVRGALTIGSQAVGTIDSEHPSVLFRFAGTADTRVDLALIATSGDLDPFLIVLDSKGRELARNDDADTANGVYDSAVNGLRLAETDDYYAIAGRYSQRFGTSTGDFTLTLTEADSNNSIIRQTEPMAYDSITSGAISDTTREQAFSFRGAAGDVVTIEMSATSGNLDAAMTLTDNLGNSLISNGDDFTLDAATDAAITRYPLPFSGYYTIIASRYAGGDRRTAGDFRLKLTLEESAPTEAPFARVAVLDPVNSRTLREDETFLDEYSAGDVLVSETELPTLTLLTFALPELGDAPTIAAATLDLAPCREVGGGWGALGDLTIYSEDFGLLDGSRYLLRPLLGASVLSEQASCDPLEVTALVQEAYAAGGGRVQFRLDFRENAANGVGDAVLFTPRLMVLPGA